ncbi:PAS/PAC sensor hybrid histidine kinase [Perkinsela sp. CCAP 1560/4]|nr:PAS/PAC sensor hybrid histidine kinase [Perkinsela sp. CCAP 1560/4]|eukprot:KNH04510.1 PAS/PAC sensor hybrid histidine kinase [Perkinsela sp. CCAP 1560/4]
MMWPLVFTALSASTWSQVATIAEINEENFERTLQEGDPWIIQFGSPDDAIVAAAREALEKYEKSTNGLVNVGFYAITDAQSFHFATLLNLPSIRDIYYFNSKHSLTKAPENTWAFPLPLSTPLPFGCATTAPTAERIAQWALQHTPTRWVDYTTMCLEPIVSFIQSTNAVGGISGTTVVFLRHPCEKLMHFAARHRRSASFISLCNKTSLRNALPGGPTMPAETACVVMGPSLQTPRTFTGDPDDWLQSCADLIESFPAPTTSTKEINRRRRMATMASLQSNMTEIVDHHAFQRFVAPPLVHGGLAIAFFTPSMAENHARYIKHYAALATKYIQTAADGKHMPMRFFHINAEVHPGISRHMGVEKIPSLICLLPASDSRMARTYYDGPFETESMLRFMKDSMMQDQSTMSEYSPPDRAKCAEYFAMNAQRSYPVEMEPCVHAEEAIQTDGVFYPPHDAPRRENTIDTSNSKKYLDVEAEKERQRKKREARSARVKGRAKSKEKAAEEL